MTTPTPPPGAIPFQQILNFRDVGLAINTLSSRPILHPSRLYRSARPDTASPTDIDILTHTFGLKTILDLRSTTEHIEQARKTSTTTTKIPSLTYHEISFNGTAFSLALVRRLSWSSMSRLAYLYARGYRTDAISILGREVMAPRGLAGLGVDSLAYCGAEVRACFEVLGDESKYPILVHCTQGKDRTGLVVLLVCLLCGVGEEAIERDYVVSEAELQTEMESRLREIRSIGLTDEFAGCPPDWTRKMIEHINEQYGGVEEYLLGCGVTKETQSKVKNILIKK
ncbi:hypothetical protein MBLNU457_3601t1 [Dothideomycetes sp. NU457]